MATRVATSDGLTTYEVGIPLMLWRPRLRPLPEGALNRLADGSERLVGVPLLGRIGWLGLIIYLVGLVIGSVARLILIGLEWLAVIVVSAGALGLRFVGGRGFTLRADLVGYIGVHQPRNGQVDVGPPGRPIIRPVRTEWRFPSLSAARSSRRVVANQVQRGDFGDVVGY